MSRKLFKSIIVLFILLYLVCDVYIYFCYNDKHTTKALTWSTRAFASVPEDSIPDKIIHAYEKVFPDALTNKIYPDLFWSVITQRHNNSYVQINLAYEITRTSKFKLISVANQLDNKLTTKQCIYAYLNRFDFLNNARGISSAAKLYYNKNIKDLTELECLELMIMTKNPAVFNKFRHQDKLDKEVQKLK